MLLGNRYGWRPLPSEIPADEFEKIIPLVTREEKVLLKQWYRRDDNAVLPAYLLQPRTDENWELASGRLLRSLEGHAGWVLAVAVTPDGAQVVSGAANRILMPDSAQVVSGATNKPLKIWDLASGRLLCSPDGHTEEVTDLVVTPDGKQVFVSIPGGALKVWDLATGGYKTLFQNPWSSINALAANGHWLVCGDSGGRVWIFEWVK